MTEGPKLAVVGAGLIGIRHIEAIDKTAAATLACIVDPAEAGQAAARAVVLEHSATGVSNAAQREASFASGRVHPAGEHVDVLVRGEVGVGVRDAGKHVGIF